MSSHRGLAALALSTSLALGACVKTAERFDEFSARVVDADPTASGCTPLTGVEDLTGQHFLAISVSVSPTQPLKFTCATTYDGSESGGDLALSCTPLKVSGLTPLGDPLEGAGEVASDGTFAITFGTEADPATVPGMANPISGSDISTNGLTIDGTVCNASFFCGDLAGAIQQPPVGDVTGTFGAVRIDPGTEGEDLPEPIVECPADE
jgi:hypothetical protein